MEPASEQKTTSEADLLQSILSNPNFDSLSQKAEEYLLSQQPQPEPTPKKPSLASRLKQKASERFGFNKEVDPNRRAFLKAAAGTAGLVGAAVLTGLNPFSSSEAKIPEQPTPTPTEIPPTPTPEKPINLMDELLKPLLDDIKMKREQAASSDPEYDIRVDQQLKSREINFLIVGTGSEMSYGEEDADAILAASYNQKDNTLGLVSIHRDTQSPEVFQESQKKGLSPQWYESEIMRAIRVGGIPLLQKAVEATTGLSMTGDYYMELKKEALPEFIDKVFGKIKINVPQDIPKDMYGMGPFTKGEQEMDGKRILEYFTSRSSTTMERRNSAQQQVMELMINQIVADFASNNALENVMLLNKIRDAFSHLVMDKKITTNIPFETVLNSAASRLPGLLAQAAATRIAGKPLIERPMVKRIIFGEGAELKRYDPTKSGPRKALMSYVDPTTKLQNMYDAVKMAGTNTKALVSEYYKYPRQVVKQILGS